MTSGFVALLGSTGLKAKLRAEQTLLVLVFSWNLVTVTKTDDCQLHPLTLI